ncbi:MAG: hypothetical protein IJD07_04715 [Clostridia bacterium]|nr:hypothetical protein [Clostridia bacterium]
MSINFATYAHPIIFAFSCLASLAISVFLSIYYVKACLHADIEKADKIIFIVFWFFSLLGLIVSNAIATNTDEYQGNNSFMCFTKNHPLWFTFFTTLIFALMCPIAVILTILAIGIAIAILILYGFSKIGEKTSYSSPTSQNNSDDDNNDEEQFDAQILDGGTYLDLKKDTYQFKRYEETYTDERGNKWYSDDGGKTFHQ